jgi:upstream activation factor subunit UAF30
MPKKSSKAVSEAEHVSHSVVEPEHVSHSVVESTTQVVDKKTKKPKSSKLETTHVVENVVNSEVTSHGHTLHEPVHEPVHHEPVHELTPLETTDVETSLVEQSVEFLSKLQKLSNMISNLKTEYRNLEKKWTKEVKIAQKVSSKKKRKAGNRAPSGFVKPTKISDELATFLGKEKGSEMARTEVTRDINKYIRNNKLQDKENGRKINPDTKLAVLLKLKKSDELTYFNLQRYMSPHFAKVSKETAVV